MLDLETAITGILQREGSAFTDDAQDAATKWGVTVAALKDFRPSATIGDLQTLDEAGARAFYRWRFQPFAALRVDERVWVNILDAVTLHGPTGAVKAIQTALGVPIDGQLGPLTVGALHVLPPPAFCRKFANARAAICVEDVKRDIVARYGQDAIDQTDLKYLRGWIRRIIQVGFAILAVSLMAACASVTARRVTPVLRAVPVVPLLLGLNDGGHTGVPPSVVDRYCSWNRELVIRAAVLTIDEAAVVLDSLAACPRLHALLLVETNDLALVRALSGFSRTRTDLWGVELGNELDLAGLSPQQFATFIGTGQEALRASGYPGHILTGGIYTVDRHEPQEFDDYLAPAIAACPDCIVGLHWYGDTSDAWLARVQALGRPVAITEFGMPACTSAQEAAQLAYVRQQLAAYARTGTVIAAIAYQRLSAPAPCDNSDASHLAHFGFERPDGTLKPAVAIFTEGTP